MAAPVFRIPLEIWRMIFAPLSPSDLCAVCRTHRHWRSVAEPSLYARVEWTWNWTRTESQNPPIPQFLRSIVHRPELASFVHTVILNGYHVYNNGRAYLYQSPKLHPDQVTLDGLVDCIHRFHVPYADEWIQELCAGTMDAFVTLLLSQLPNLRCLYLSENFTRDIPLLGRMLRLALCEQSRDSHFPSFSYLQDVSAVHDYVDTEIRKHTDIRNAPDVLPLFYLPSIERIRTLIDNPVTFVWPGGYPPIPSKLTSLDLEMLREGHLGQVLSVTPGLRKLKWHWYYRPDLKDRVVTSIMNLDQIATDLSHVKDTLTDLTITAASDPYQADPGPPKITFRGSFKVLAGLQVLERLEVPIPFLLGFYPSTPNVVNLQEALPKSIQWLTLTDDLSEQDQWEWEYETESLLEVFRAWLQDWKKSTPHLQGFRLLMKQMKVWSWAPEMIQGLRDMGAETGIQIEIVD